MKGEIAEATEDGLILRCWVGREYLTNCHKLLWSAIDGIGTNLYYPISIEPLDKAVLFN